MKLKDCTADKIIFAICMLVVVVVMYLLTACSEPVDIVESFILRVERLDQ